MKYKASLDRLAIGMTIGVILLVIVIAIAGFAWNQPILVQFDIVVPFAVVVMCYLFAPKSYTVNENELTINRPIGKVHIALKDIIKVEKIDRFEGFTIRTFGNGGLFGFYGRYYNSVIGKMILYTTRSNNRILIKTNKEKNIVISPDDITLADRLNLMIHKA